MSEDRSRQEQIEQKLVATEERFRVAQAAGGIGWFEWDLVNNEWEWTPHVAVLFPTHDRRSLVLSSLCLPVTTSASVCCSCGERHP